MLRLFGFSILVVLSVQASLLAQEKGNDLKVVIDTQKGHHLEEGASGFNVRIADKVWSYEHPDFRAAVHGIKPGWLRYFSGTMGDAFNSATGQYDHDYTAKMDHQKSYNTGYVYTEVKGPHRISDLYELLGEVGGKLVVTVNGFTESPTETAELARFCKNNNIIVEAWQFCNEPYFYVPHRERYWWNDGYDYARKMKAHADEILKVYPDAKLALNCTWDGIWGFMKEIHEYQEDKGRYWNVFSKHSYAPHIGGSEPFEKAMRRANTKVIEATDDKAMQEIEDYTWEGAPLMITEFGVWNSPLNGIYSAIYNAEYTLRQLSHSNAFLIASHEISNKFRPGKNYRDTIFWAFKNGKSINTCNLSTGIVKDDEGKAMEILHEATNNSNYAWNTYIKGGPKVPGMHNEKVEALYALAFKGIDGYDFLALTNRSAQAHRMTIDFGGHILDQKVERHYMSSLTAQNRNISQHKDVVEARNMELPPYSVMLVRWKTHEKQAPLSPRIFKTRVTPMGIELDWWGRKNADAYLVEYGYTPECKDGEQKILGAGTTHTLLKNLKEDQPIYMRVKALNKIGVSAVSNMVSRTFGAPSAPEIFRIAPHENMLTVYWNSVPNADGYRVSFKNTKTGELEICDAKNVFGFRQENFNYDIPYEVSVSAYNGFKEGAWSSSQVSICKKDMPIPPRNISATQLSDGRVKLHWINQDNIHDDIEFSILRGERLYEFDTIAQHVTSNSFIDEPEDTDRLYFYTIATSTASGYTNSYPNIATMLKHENAVDIMIDSIQKKDDAYRVRVVYRNIPLDGDIVFGITISDISYLNVEERKFFAGQTGDKVFWVNIPFEDLKMGGEYAIKGFVETNGAPIFSQPPYKTFKY